MKIVILMLLASLSGSSSFAGGCLGKMAVCDVENYPVRNPVRNFPSVDFCEVMTACPNGVPIYCWVFGATATGGLACSAFFVSNYSVQCSGFDSSGNWNEFYLKCY